MPSETTMNHTLTTATAGAQLTCAQKKQGSPALPGMGTIHEQHFFTPVYRRDLERSIRSLRRDLGFSTSEQAVLIALTSFLPCYDRGQERPIGPDLLLTIFASNEALCDRAGGINDRTLRRCINKLEERGWVIRRDSANGKRFARKSKGQPVAAFGIDISPLLQKSAGIINQAQRKAEIEEERRGLIAEAKALIAECERRSSLTALLDFQFFKKALRRVTMTVHHIKEMIRTLRDHLAETHGATSESDHQAQPTTSRCTEPHAEQIDHGQLCDGHLGNEMQANASTDVPEINRHTADIYDSNVQPRNKQVTGEAHIHSLKPPVQGQETADLSASDGQNARHKETRKSESKNARVRVTHDPTSTWDTCSELQAFFPDRPRSTHAVMQLLFKAARLLRIGDALIAEAVQKLPLSSCMTILDTMMQQAAQIASPDGYFKTMISNGYRR